MTSNILEEHDPDFDASVSSVNSDSEKVDSLLIKRILSEMKSEFNRGTEQSEDGNENEDSSEASAVNNLEQKTTVYDKNCEDEVEVKEEVVDNSFSTESLTEQLSDEGSNQTLDINKKISDAEEEEEEEREERKPRLILTLRTSEGDREISGRTSRRSLVCQRSSDLVNSGLSIRSDISTIEKNDEDKGSMWESRSRRSLRSSSRIIDRNSDNEIRNENAGMTRTSRRFSKEHCRESVLQSAIARKEKSFSSLNQVEERSTRRGARSPRQSPNEMKINKPMTRSKSPKTLINLMDKTSKTESAVDSDLSSKQEEINDAHLLMTVKTEQDVDSSFSKSDQYEFSEDSNDTTNLNSANSQTSEPPTDFKQAKLDKIYTKTGKRRTKHFKGLKYSLTTGGSVVRKKSLHVSKRGRPRKNQPSTIFSHNIDSVEINLKIEPADTVTNETNDLATDNETSNYDDKESYHIGEGSDCDTVKNDSESTFSVNLLNSKYIVIFTKL